ncbi:MAG TPA: RodZ domain-containing protein, partial [Bryobacteraceae bacterium]|nr:RodZ domain-containing protein [Bryobacteraceae bacterium]
EFFYKAFIRQYARALELDVPTTDRILGAAVPTSDPDPLPVLKGVYENAQTGRSTRWRPSTAVAVTALLLVVAGGSALYALWQRLQSQSENPAAVTQPQAAAPSPAQTPAPGAETSAPPSPAPADSSAPPVSTPPSAGATVAGASGEQSPGNAPGSIAPGQTVVELAATESVWVHLTSEGKTVFIGVLDPAQARQFPVGAAAKLLTGNAGGLDVRVNGKSLGSLGPRGQIRTVLFTPEGTQVVPPTPKVPAEPTPGTRP